MKFTSLMATIFFMAASMKGHGQERAGMSLSQIWEHGLANYPTLEIYRSQHRQADLDEKLTRNRLLPDVHLQLQNVVGSASGAFFPLPGLYNVNGSPLENSSEYAAHTFGSVVMDWKFLQFGQQRKSREAAGIFTNQAAHRLEVERLNIQSVLSRLYFQLFFHERMEEWAQNNSERLQSIFEASARKVKAGLSAGADSLLMSAALGQTNADLHVWRGRKEETKIALARWMDISVDQLIVKDAPFFSDDDPYLIIGTESEQLHPRLAFKKEQIAFVEKQKELASASALPSLSLLGGFQVRGNSIMGESFFYESWGRPVYNYAVGLGLTWNIGSAIDSGLKKRRYEEAVRQTVAETEEVALGLSSLEETAQQQMMQSLQQMTNANKAFESARQAYGLFQARYNSGLISITELLQIQDVLQKSARTRIEAYYQYWLQHVNLAESTADFSYLQKIFE